MTNLRFFERIRNISDLAYIKCNSVLFAICFDFWKA